MTSETPYRIAALVLTITILGISAYFRRRANREGGTLNPEGGTLLLLLRLAAVVVYIPFILYLINPDWVVWAQFPAPPWLRWLGALLTVMMVPLIYWLFSTIGNNISPSHTTRADHQLITTGPYRYIRHPLYTFGTLAFTGLGLLAAMWWLLMGWAMVFVFIAYRTTKEEAHLLAEFGDEYEQYMVRTGRYLPKFGARR